MQAIVTKYLPATNFRGSRIKASCERGSITIDYPSELSGDAVHIAAADALVAKFVKEDAKRYGSNPNPWSKPRVCGSIPGGCVHVFSDFESNVVIGCANFEDAQTLSKIVRKAQPDGQIAPLYAGLLGMIFKRGSI